MTVFRRDRSLTDAEDRFDEMARTAFELQVARSPIYGRYAADTVWSGWEAAPFLPVEAFKWDGIVASDASPAVVFLSSGTGGRPSRHPVLDLSLYHESTTAGFSRVFGEGPFRFLAHLPAYARETSSLVYMVDHLISRFGASGSCLVDDVESLREEIAVKRPGSEQLVLFGTAFGLLDAIGDGMPTLPEGSIVVETGGMKTFRREMDRRQLHARLSSAFGLPRERVYSEYGMCELLSQCYTRGNEIFEPPPWMRFLILDVDRPDRLAQVGRPGLLALFDLANLHSVSAVLTSDLAIGHEQGFELVGRAHAAEIRGCNFLLGSDP